ncbi:hypothetical protein P170DRAFT_135728 [Aspergillus steynii IBT 23096]|uniref:Uncharacterized protein n=1 Tax=Aspergillus steynii IBT 23096 TaxID=1392250 RepID=A0A2I2GB26_9EURO|nr:uncharacterized protein P170DRAFT_135728 [Aspergillus steynii IBT 23096]PLB50088.1 hypothetical protein P170DRAFT_135728 [Aspergillus steynii IBT 23096]
MCMILLRHGAQVNMKNERTGEVLLHWAIRGGHIAVTELLLANKADKSLVDLSEIRKEYPVKENDFQLCKVLLETAPNASDQLNDLSVVEADEEASRTSTPTIPPCQTTDHAAQREEVTKGSSTNSIKDMPFSELLAPPPQIVPSRVSVGSPSGDDYCCTEALTMSQAAACQYLHRQEALHPVPKVVYWSLRTSQPPVTPELDIKFGAS